MMSLKRYRTGGGGREQSPRISPLPKKGKNEVNIRLI